MFQNHTSAPCSSGAQWRSGNLVCNGLFIFQLTENSSSDPTSWKPWPGAQDRRRKLTGTVSFSYKLYLHCMLHYTVVILHAWLLRLFPDLYFLKSYNGIFTYCPFAFLFCILVPYSVFTNFTIAFIFSLITLFFIQHYSLFSTILYSALYCL